MANTPSLSEANPLVAQSSLSINDTVKAAPKRVETLVQRVLIADAKYIEDFKAGLNPSIDELKQALNDLESTLDNFAERLEQANPQTLETTAIASDFRSEAQQIRNDPAGYLKNIRNEGRVPFTERYGQSRSEGLTDDERTATVFLALEDGVSVDEALVVGGVDPGSSLEKAIKEAASELPSVERELSSAEPVPLEIG